MKKLLLITAITLSFVIMLTVGCNRKKETDELQKSKQQLKTTFKASPTATSAWRALSLRVLDEQIKKYMASREYPDDILKLGGITRFHGFVVDERKVGEEGDVILVGEIDDALPPLYLDDFVIALRNAWWKYAPLKGNTYYYSSPGCSIDPDPQTLVKLQKVGGGIFGNLPQEKAKEVIQQWHATCSKPQKVRVMGIPRDTRFAKVMVEADYYMKRLVDGSVSLDIEGFTSLVDMTLSRVKEDIVKGRSISIPPQFLNRFWFFPGENQYAEAEGTVFIKRCDVKLLTEAEFLTQKGEIAGSGRADPLAKEFADSFTERYEEIAQRKQIYAEQESLFRFASLAKAMKHRNALSAAGIHLDYLMNQYPVAKTEVSKTLPGISNVKEFHHEAKIPGGVSIAHLWLPSCGGVSIDISPSEDNFTKDKIIAPDGFSLFRERDLINPVSLAAKLRNIKSVHSIPRNYCNHQACRY